jgi:hypothetical protein
LVIASLLFLACLFPGQHLISNLLPGISGVATANPGLIIFDIPVHLPVAIDLILLPALFFLFYAVVILLYPSRHSVTTWRETIPRLGAALAGLFIFLLAAASGGFISYLVRDRLPKNVRNGIDSLGITADISLPFSACKTIHLPGNIITLIGLIIGFALCVVKISRTPGTKNMAPLTREQRMTPYERMQREKKQPVAGNRPDTINKTSAKARCQNHPLLTLEPEAVAYMPMR